MHLQKGAVEMKLVTAALLATAASAASPWGPEPRQRAATKLAQMSQTDKLNIVHGSFVQVEPAYAMFSCSLLACRL
jgi:hypothetical protein